MKKLLVGMVLVLLCSAFGSLAALIAGNQLQSDATFGFRRLDYFSDTLIIRDRNIVVNFPYRCMSRPILIIAHKVLSCIRFHNTDQIIVQFINSALTRTVEIQLSLTNADTNNTTVKSGVRYDKLTAFTPLIYEGNPSEPSEAGSARFIYSNTDETYLYFFVTEWDYHCSMKINCNIYRLDPSLFDTGR